MPDQTTARPATITTHALGRTRTGTKVHGIWLRDGQRPTAVSACGVRCGYFFKPAEVERVSDKNVCASCFPNGITR